MTWRVEMKAVITFHAGKEERPVISFSADADTPIESVLLTINQGLKMLQDEMRQRITMLAPKGSDRLAHDPVSLEKALADYSEARKMSQE